MALVVSCPAFFEGDRCWGIDGRMDRRRALFLLSEDQRLIGAYHQAKGLDAGQARALWHQHPWQPVTPGQPWPAPVVAPTAQEDGW